MTHEQDLSARIRALPGRHQGTKIEMIRAVLEDIENAISRGVPRQSILDELNRDARGLEISMNSFATMLKRAREERKARVVERSELLPGDRRKHEKTLAEQQKGKREQSL